MDTVNCQNTPNTPVPKPSAVQEREKAHAPGAAFVAGAPVLETREVTKQYWQNRGFMRAKKPFYAVKDVSLSLPAGKTLGLVGESGCGKSTLARMICGLLQPSSGEVLIGGLPLHDAKAHADVGGDFRQFRREVCKTVQMVFQDPQSSLNPRMRILESVGEPLACLHPEMQREARENAVRAMLQEVGISPERALLYPHSFSGGQRQRIAIARALITRPKLVICDEPTSSLDSSVQAQVLNLLDDLQERFHLAYLFISHDLAVVRHMSDHVAVMYAGEVVEQGHASTVFAEPAHAYTQELFRAGRLGRAAM
jgi:ATPase components of various ABC-type transport systems, contain duplicated ATPase